MSSEAGSYALIEHLRGSGVCSNPRKVAVVRRNEDSKQATIFLPPCKTWGCIECAERNKSRWLHRVLYGIDHYIRQGFVFSFVTMTLGGRYKARADSIDGWRKVWPRVYDRYRRAFGRQPYVILPECHRNGRVHLHAIIGAIAGERWYKDNVWSCGGGFMASCEKVWSVQAAGSYAMKYMTKTTGLVRWPRKFKRIRVSHHWPNKPVKALDPNSLYTVLNPAQLAWTVAWLWRIGYDVRQGTSNDLVEMLDL